jgi:hypothetical protein
MNDREIARRRLHNQHLWGDPRRTPADVVQRLAAMQSQEFAYAKWSVAQRAQGASDAAMDEALASGTILRIHVLRPTWHFVRPADIRWLLKATAPRIQALNAHYYRKCELDDQVFAKTNGLLAKVLAGGRQRTRQELVAVLERAGIEASGVRLAYVLMRAELDAVICSGARRGKQHTYAAFDERVPRAKTLDRDQALAELARRYFSSRGPATLKDFVTWASLTIADGTRGLESIRPTLEQEVVDGRSYWFTSSTAPAAPKSPVIDLVQGYDEYVMSYSESKDVLFGSRRRQSRARSATTFLHAILLDGQLAGHWRHALERKAVVVETSLDRPLVRAEARALDAAVERYGRFMGVPARRA